MDDRGETIRCGAILFDRTAFSSTQVRRSNGRGRGGRARHELELGQVLTEWAADKRHHSCCCAVARRRGGVSQPGGSGERGYRWCGCAPGRGLAGRIATGGLLGGRDLRHTQRRRGGARRAPAAEGAGDSRRRRGSELGCRGVRAVGVPEDEADGGAVIFELCGPEERDFLHFQRTIGIAKERRALAVLGDGGAAALRADGPVHGVQGPRSFRRRSPLHVPPRARRYPDARRRVLRTEGYALLVERKGWKAPRVEKFALDACE